jgi:hypothetical protein
MDLSENSVPLNQLVNDEFPFYGVYVRWYTVYHIFRQTHLGQKIALSHLIMYLVDTLW